MATRYQALLVVSFGGPEKMEDVLPFLENVVRGKHVPRERLLEVASHYEEFGGRSPLNQQNRDLIRSVETELANRGLDLPIYFGNRNWSPFLTDALQRMKVDGVSRALAFFTSAYSSYSGCRQYRQDIARAREAVGAGAPRVDRLRAFFNHPGFIRPNVEHLQRAMSSIPQQQLKSARLIFSAHSIPTVMAEKCRYVEQLRETARLTASGAGWSDWDLVYQSRSGPPRQPWLEPDICDRLDELGSAGVRDVIVAPIGFISDHLEVLYDLDREAQGECLKLGMRMHRVRTVGTHPAFVAMICDLVEERLSGTNRRPALGRLGPSHDFCPEDCCLPGLARPERP